MNTLPDRSVTHVGKLYCHLCTEVQQLVEPARNLDPQFPQIMFSSLSSRMALLHVPHLTDCPTPILLVAAEES